MNLEGVKGQLLHVHGSLCRCVIPLDSYPFLGSRDPVAEDRRPQDHSTSATLLMSMSRPVHSPAPGNPERMIQQRYSVEENVEARDGQSLCLLWIQEEAFTKKTQKRSASTRKAGVQWRRSQL